MTQKIINTISISPILECQFNLTQGVRGIMKSRSIFTTKCKGGNVTKLKLHVK